jgi:hypothetical protein
MPLVDFRKALNETDEVEITVPGRTSGRRTSRPVWFVQQGDMVYLPPEIPPD